MSGLTLKDLLKAKKLTIGETIRVDWHPNQPDNKTGEGTLLETGDVKYKGKPYSPTKFVEMVVGKRMPPYGILYSSDGTAIETIRQSVQSERTQLAQEPRGDEDVHEDEAPVEAPQQHQQPSTGGRRRQQTRRFADMKDDGKIYVDRNDDEQQPAPKKSRPADDSSSSDDDADEAALRAQQKKRASSQADCGQTYVERDDDEQPAPKKSRPADDSSSSDDDADEAALRAQQKRASSQAVQNQRPSSRSTPRRRFDVVDAIDASRRPTRPRRDASSIAWGYGR